MMRVVCCTLYSPREFTEYGPNCCVWGIVTAVTSDGSMTLEPVAGYPPPHGYECDPGQGYIIPDEDTHWDVPATEIPPHIWAQLLAAMMTGEQA